ncbi:rRNA processing protein Rrp17 [Schizosaccharomyces cryophilus OY26]|uniref:rRNA processing protein Rrp17 n=1 Tax=Schizosaccharomyces cryophilus (strain OY26 / ATCC MYA-4695 / CBS 11777 / NBRC 106824 / NRRL Y48691) TaxID=653667 RepID=S9X8S3_SCHCR|nr:rRNA processing protein Rrp17 [Schizosaccharomyces cryophilus OY26]EPY50231.1 rRNA processing protein Rrp17 [Schizosaccharomyces cryophilus OY26]
MDNTALLTRGGNVYDKKRGRKQHQEEIIFDKEQRKEFLTGFHKRKVERQKHAQAMTEKQQREEKREMRKLVREQRKKQLEERIQLSRELMGTMEKPGSEDEGSDGAETEEKVVIEDDDEPHTREYEDEDKHVSVTITEDDENDGPDEEELADGFSTPQNDPPPSVPIRPHKQKQGKNRFRYESKEDRRLNQKKSKIQKLKHAVRHRH